MGWFTPKTPEQIAAEEKEKIRKTLEQYGLNLDDYTADQIKQKNIDNLKKIASDLIGNKWFKAGMALSFASGEEQAKVTYLSALVEQNWILIRQNELIIKELQKLNKK